MTSRHASHAARYSTQEASLAICTGLTRLSGLPIVCAAISRLLLAIRLLWLLLVIRRSLVVVLLTSWTVVVAVLLGCSLLILLVWLKLLLIIVSATGNNKLQIFPVSERRANSAEEVLGCSLGCLDRAADCSQSSDCRRLRFEGKLDRNWRRSVVQGKT